MYSELFTWKQQKDAELIYSTKVFQVQTVKDLHFGRVGISTMVTFDDTELHLPLTISLSLIDEMVTSVQRSLSFLLSLVYHLFVRRNEIVFTILRFVI